MAFLDDKQRSPRVETLADLRVRVTRTYDVMPEVPKTETASGVQPGYHGTIVLPWGTPDVAYPDCLLVKQTISGQADENGNNPKAPTDKFPQVVRTWETINPSGETAVGDPEVNEGQDGLITVVLNYIQFSVAVAGITPTYLTIGSSSISSPFSAVLKLEERTDDGTLQRIKRTYVTAGLVTEDTATKYDGALTLLTQTWVNDPQSPPSGYTLVDHKEDYPGGLRVDTYTWAKGTGQISTQTEYRLSPDQGTTGVTVTTIKYLTIPSVGTNPITPPGGSEEIAITMEEGDGYRTWLGIYASGQGTIATEVVYKFTGTDSGAPNSAGLVETTITAINLAPSAPSAVVGGVVVLINAEVRNGTRFEDGTKIYVSKFAEAAGGATGQQISSETVYEDSVNQGTAGITRTTIKQITAPGSTMQPTSGPGGSILHAFDYTDGEGYRMWTTKWAAGTGTIRSDTETKEYGKLIIYTVEAINTPPSTPSSTIGGTVVLIDAKSDIDSGVTIYTYKWAEGKGLVIDESHISESGVLVVYHRVSLGIAPTAPSSTIGGTLNLFESNITNEDGYQKYDYRWSEGNGQADITTEGREDGAILYTVTDNSSTLPVAAPSYPGGGTAYCTVWTIEAKDGYWINKAVWHLPPATAALSRQMQFRYPGTIAILSAPSGLQFNPPVDMDILATDTVSYGITQVTTTPFTVKAYAYVAISYVPTNQSTPKQTVTQSKAAGGYLSGATGSSGTNSIFNGILCDSWSYTISSSTPSTAPSGSTVVKVHNDIYLVDINGTVVYRRHSIAYTF